MDTDPSVRGAPTGALRTERAPGARAALIPICLAVFLTAMDNTVVNVAVPSIQAELHLSTSGVEWIATGYILSFSSLLLVGGRLADLLGRRRMFLVGTAAFVATSTLCGLAVDGGMLIAARALQGVGAAMVLPATLSILSADVDEADRDLGAGLWTATIALALAVGPLVGGAITEYWHWSGIFYINLPVGVVAMVLAARAVPPDAPAHPKGYRRPRGSLRAELDLPGLVSSSLCFLTVTYALVQGQDHGFSSPVILGAVLASVVAGIAFVVIEARAAAPMVDVSLFRNRVFSGGTAGQVLWGLGVNGVFFFTSLFLQDVLHYSPTAAGLAFLPMAISLMIFVPSAPSLAARYGAHRTVACGMIVLAVGMVMSARLTSDSTFVDLLPCLLTIGVGSALTVPVTSSVLAVVPPERAGMASAIVSTAREVSGVFGIAVVGAIVVVRQSAQLRSGADSSTAFQVGYAAGLHVGAALVLVGALVTLVALRPGADSLPAAGPDASRHLGTGPVRLPDPPTDPYAAPADRFGPVAAAREDGTDGGWRVDDDTGGRHRRPGGSRGAESRGRHATGGAVARR